MNEIQVNVKSAIIEISEREKVEQEINELAQRFSNYAPTADTLSGDRALRAELRKRIKELDDARKAVKKEYNLPLKEFEDWVKKASQPLNKVISDIDQGIKELEEHEKMLRLSTISATFNEKASAVGLDPRIFSMNHEKYAVAANFTAQKKLKKGILDEIDVAIQYEVQKQEQYKNDKSSISTYALEYGLSDNPYVRDLDNGVSLNEIIANIIKDGKAKKERDEEMARKAREFEEKKLADSFNVPEELTESLNFYEKSQDGKIVQEQSETPSAPKYEPERQAKKLKRLTLEIIIDENNPLLPFRPFLDDNGYQYRVTGYEDI